MLVIEAVLLVSSTTRRPSAESTYTWSRPGSTAISVEPLPPGRSAVATTRRLGRAVGVGLGGRAAVALGLGEALERGWAQAAWPGAGLGLGAGVGAGGGGEARRRLDGRWRGRRD